MMNSRRGEPRALFTTFYLINRKKAVDPEDHSTKGIHFEFHASKAHSYTYRVIFISLLLYSDLYCKKWLIFYGSSSCYNDNKIKMKEKKKERKNILPFGKIRSRETFRCTQGRYHKTTKAFSNVQRRRFYGEEWKTSSPKNACVEGYECTWCEKFLFKQNWRHHHRKHIQSV